MCEAIHGAISSFLPVKILITPAGTSLVAITSAKLIAESGALVLAKTIAVFPPTIIGAMASMSPSKEGDSGAIAAMTPMLSGTVKL
jgi:hypothetical protein